MKAQTALSLLVFGVLVAACRSPQIEIVRPTPTPTTLPAAVLTPDTSLVRYRPEPIVGQLVLTTQVAPDGTPRDERSSVPVGTQQLYLAVRVTDVPSGTRFVAVWVRGTEEIGRSERQIDQALAGAHWIALALPSNLTLRAGDYVVRLYQDDRLVDSIVFWVGDRRGTLTEEPATLVFSDAAPSEGSPVRAREVFPQGTTRVIAILLDAPSDTSTALWSRWTLDGRVLTERGADELTMPFVRTFTLSQAEGLPAGTYVVEIFADQRAVARGTFRILGATPTPTPVETVASVEEVRIVEAIDPGTGTPVGASVREIRGPARVYLALFVRDLQPQDTLEVVWQRAGTVVSRQPISGLSLSAQWIVLPFDVAHEANNGPVTYAVTVWLNGAAVAERTLVVTP